MLTATCTGEMQSPLDIAFHRGESSRGTKDQDASYKLLVLVALLHVMLLLALLTTSSQKLEVKPELTTMTVSLISSVINQSHPKEVKVQKEKLNTPVKPMAEVKKQEVKTAVVLEKVNAEIFKNIVTDEKNPSEDAPIEKASSPTESKPQEPVEESAIAAPASQEVIEPPKFGVAYLNNPAPEYPKMARRSGQEGRVILKVLVTENGKPENVALATSSGYETLDQAAIEAVKKWSFIPAKRNNQAMSASVLVPVKFSLNN